MTDPLPSLSARLPVARLPFAAGAAIATTFGLFWIMQALVATELALPDPEPLLRVDIVRLKKEPSPPPPEPRRKHTKPEPAPLPPTIGTPTTGIEDVFALPPPDDAGTWHGDDPLRSVGQSLAPLVRVEPEYPLRAEQRGIAGWVDLAFTVTATGHVEDARVIRSRPPGVFDASALRAVQRWRYRPRHEYGRPVPAIDQRVRIQFEPAASGTSR